LTECVFAQAESAGMTNTIADYYGVNTVIQYAGTSFAFQPFYPLFKKIILYFYDQLIIDIITMQAVVEEKNALGLENQKKKQIFFASIYCQLFLIGV